MKYEKQQQEDDDTKLRIHEKLLISRAISIDHHFKLWSEGSPRGRTSYTN